jgi:hypothetical protein
VVLDLVDHWITHYFSPIWVIEQRKKDVSFIDSAIVEKGTDQVLTSYMVNGFFQRAALAM